MTAFTIEIEGLDALERDWRGGFLPRVKNGLGRCVRRAVDDGARLAKQLVPVSDEAKIHLRDKIAGRVLGAEAGESGMFSVTGQIEALMPYASFVENGTRPHIIRPKDTHGSFADGWMKVRMLAWEGEGGQGDWHFAREVHHPGTKPHPFMGPAYFKAEQRLEAEVSALLAQEADRFNQG